jgi:hypothetical protein
MLRCVWGRQLKDPEAGMFHHFKPCTKTNTQSDTGRNPLDPSLSLLRYAEKKIARTLCIEGQMPWCIRHSIKHKLSSILNILVLEKTK